MLLRDVAEAHQAGRRRCIGAGAQRTRREQHAAHRTVRPVQHQRQLARRRIADQPRQVVLEIPAQVVEQPVDVGRQLRVARHLTSLGYRHVRRYIAGKQFDLIFANIPMRPLIRLAPKLVRALEPDGTLILSGLLRSQAPLVREAYASRGLILERQIPKEAWMTLVWKKPQRE